MPLAGGSWSVLGSTLFFWGTVMPTRRTSTSIPQGGNLLPLPLDQRKWIHLASNLRLPPQQQKIVELILRGMQDKQIAIRLGISVPTVRTYLSRLYARLGVSDRMELVLKLFADSQHMDDID
jgi:DNA-binding NarL/FixJ family response regulator